MTKYTRGRKVEYQARDLFEDNGFHVMRSAGSKFPDLFTAKKIETEDEEEEDKKKCFYVECKKKTSPLSDEEKERGKKIKERTGFPVIVAVREKNPEDKRKTRIVFYNLEEEEQINPLNRDL